MRKWCVLMAAVGCVVLAASPASAEDRADGPPVAAPGVITKGSGDTSIGGHRRRQGRYDRQCRYDRAGVIQRLHQRQASGHGGQQRPIVVASPSPARPMCSSTASRWPARAISTTGCKSRTAVAGAICKFTSCFKVFIHALCVRVRALAGRASLSRWPGLCRRSGRTAVFQGAEGPAGDVDGVLEGAICERPAVCRTRVAPGHPRVRPRARADRIPVSRARPHRAGGRQPAAGGEVFHRQPAGAREGLRQGACNRCVSARVPRESAGQTRTSRCGRAVVPARPQDRAGCARTQSCFLRERQCQPGRCEPGAGAVGGCPGLLSGSDPADHGSGHVLRDHQAHGRERDPRIPRHVRRTLPHTMAAPFGAGVGQGGDDRRDVRGGPACVADVRRRRPRQDDGTAGHQRYRSRAAHPQRAGQCRQGAGAA